MNPLRTGSRQPPRIVREPGTTVHAQIEDWLAGQIATGALAPGDRLPAEQDLAGRFGVSRMTLRHALAALARRGLASQAAGRRHGPGEGLAQLPAGVGEAEAREVAEGAPLMWVERTAYAGPGEPLEFARDLFRGDRTRVVVWTSDLPEDSAIG